MHKNLESLMSLKYTDIQRVLYNYPSITGTKDQLMQAGSTVDRPKVLAEIQCAVIFYC